MNTDDIQLPHLETFSKAAELGSFTGAAKALCLTQAAVSQRIHALEKSLDKSLFDRRGGRVMLTEAGRQLHAYVLQILDLHRAARREITGHDLEVVGELVIAASSVPGEYLLPALLSAFGRKYPHIRVKAAVTNSTTVLRQVERGEVNLGLVGRKDDDPHLEFRFLTSDRMVLVAPDGHALIKKKKKVTVDQLTAHALVLQVGGSGLRHCFEKALMKAGRSLGELRVTLELGSNEAIKDAVLRGMGVAVLSLYAVRKELKSGELHALEIKDVHCDREMFVVLDRRRVTPLPARLFLLFLEANPIPDLVP
jgi:DNA-binding transcriptional LysR family regulator